MADLYGREWAVRIFGEGVARQWLDLRVTFDVEKTATREPNKGTIQIYNLSAQSRALFRKGQRVELEAGYRASSGLIFTGKVIHAHTERQGPDLITTIEAGDGAEIVQQAVVKSFGKGTSPDEIVDALIGAAKGDKGFREKAKSALARGRANGKSAMGSIMEELHTLVTPAGLEVSVQDGALQITEVEAATDEPAILLTVDSGLVGSPQIGDDGQVRVTALLQPGFRPRRLLRVLSRDVEGFYVCGLVKLTGDSHGADWYAEIEAKER